MYFGGALWISRVIVCSYSQSAFWRLLCPWVGLPASFWPVQSLLRSVADHVHTLLKHGAGLGGPWVALLVPGVLGPPPPLFGDWRPVMMGAGSAFWSFPTCPHLVPLLLGLFSQFFEGTDMPAPVPTWPQLPRPPASRENLCLPVRACVPRGDLQVIRKWFTGVVLVFFSNLLRKFCVFVELTLLFFKWLHFFLWIWVVLTTS